MVNDVLVHLDQARANSFGLVSVGVNRLVRLLGDWRGGGQPLHADLAHRLRVLIGDGALPSGSRLPSERSLADTLGVSRNTITTALDSLRGEGLLSSRRGDGTYVAASTPPVTARGDARLDSFVDDGRPLRIDLRSAALPGLPMVAEAMNQLDGSRMRDLVGSHGYLPAGLQELREEVAKYYSDLGLPTGPEHILVTSGAQQALRLVISGLVAPGAAVVVEEPTFRGAIESLKRAGARLIGVPSGPDGVDIAALEKLLSTNAPALVVLQSTVHNPTGSVLDGLRRHRVAAVARRYGVAVVDDATLADTVIDGDRRPFPLAGGGKNILTVGSVSKSFWGGLRVGWLRAQPEFIAELTAVKGGEDLGTSVLAQLVAAQLLPRIENARDERLRMLSTNRHLALETLDELLPEWTPQFPRGGGSLWVRLPTPQANALTQRAEQRGVQILPGSTFSAMDGFDDHVRISYAGSSASLRRGIEILASTWRELV